MISRENLAIPSRFWYLRSFFINSFLFVVLFFLTTPAIVVSSLDILTVITNHIEKMVSFPFETLLFINSSVLSYLWYSILKSNRSFRSVDSRNISFQPYLTLFRFSLLILLNGTNSISNTNLKLLSITHNFYF